MFINRQVVLCNDKNGKAKFLIISLLKFYYFFNGSRYYIRQNSSNAAESWTPWHKCCVNIFILRQVFEDITVVIVYINTLQTNFDLIFFNLPSFQTAWIQMNMETTGSCQLTASLCLLCKWVIRKKIVKNQNFNWKVSV